MTVSYADKKILIAGYGLPAEYAINLLFGLGYRPQNITLLTHPLDPRNQGLLALANLRGIDYKTEEPNSKSVIEWVEKIKPDILLSLHYRKKIGNAILAACNFKAVNLHPSLLPAYRGTNSVAWVIINDEKQTGFTYHYMDHEFDTGAIIYQETLAISSNETAFSLFHRQIIKALAKLELVLEFVLENKAGNRQEGAGSYYNRQLPNNGYIDVTWDMAKVERFIRAMYFPPFPPAKLLLDGQEYEVESLQQYLLFAGSAKRV